MLHHLEGLELDITDSEYHHDPTYTGEIIPSQTSNLKHVEIIKVSDKLTYDTSLESYLLGDHNFIISILFLVHHNFIISRLSSVQKRI